MSTLLSVRDLRTRFGTGEAVVRAVDGVSFDLKAGETVALVGESGSGKTAACESITGLVGSARVNGTIRFDGTDLTTLSERELRRYRGGRIGHVFQNPEGSLDPVYPVGEQVLEAVQTHCDLSADRARERAVGLLDRVGIGNAEDTYGDYPHELSGGQKQRVVIAAALAADPDLLIADEPTTALDVTVQAQVLRLLDELQSEREMGMLFVTHDLGVVAAIADRVVVMYAGKVMEAGPVDDLLIHPRHPYTRALLDCLPGRSRAFDTIEGHLPDPTDPPDGCRFHPRCSHAVDACRTDEPPMRSVDSPADTSPEPGEYGNDQRVACVLYSSDHRIPPALWEEYDRQ